MKASAFVFTALLSTSLTMCFSSSSFAAGADNRHAAHDLRSQVLRSSNGNCVRTQWTSAGDECRAVQKQVAPQPVAPVAHHAIEDEARTVYFEFNKTRLTESEKNKLNSLATTLKEMKEISGVSIVGYADRMGSSSYNEHLSKQRAGAVEKYLRARGYLNTTIAKTQWLGESVPVTVCADHLERSALINCLQQDRRVTVEVEYKDN